MSDGTAKAQAQMCSSKAEAIREVKQSLNLQITGAGCKMVKGSLDIGTEVITLGNGIKFWSATAECDWVRE